MSKSDDFMTSTAPHIIKEEQLPAPRLELRWQHLEDDRRYAPKFRCEYNFVLPVTENQVRVGSCVQFGPELRYTMGWTDVEGEHEGFPVGENGMLHTPYRDFHHATWDSYTTKLPAFVVWDGQAQILRPSPPSGPPAKYLEAASEEDPNWASKEFRREMGRVTKALWRFHGRLGSIGDRQPKGWMRAYYREVAREVATCASALGESFFFDFADWITERARRHLLDTGKETMMACATCGAKIPTDLTKACEHIFTPEERAFFERSKTYP